MFDFRRILSVVVACATRRHQRYMGNSVLQLQRMATKWSLKVPMAFSAVLFLWRFGDCLTNVGHSLSNICSFGCSSQTFKYVCIVVMAVRRSCSDLVLIGCARIAFESWLYATIMYWLPLLDLLGNLPVWSEKICH